MWESHSTNDVAGIGSGSCRNTCSTFRLTGRTSRRSFVPGACGRAAQLFRPQPCATNSISHRQTASVEDRSPGCDRSGKGNPTDFGGPLMLEGDVVARIAFLNSGALDRHRGGGHPPTRATPPCVRVRTRRFETVTLTVLEQRRESERFEIGIRKPYGQSLRPREIPGAESPARGIACQPRTNPQFDQCRLATATRLATSFKSPYRKCRGQNLVPFFLRGFQLKR